MNRVLKGIAILISCLSMMECFMPICASATTKEDVIAVAKEVGMPEDLIQNYISMGANMDVSSEDCDKAIAQLYQVYGKTNNQISKDFDVDIQPDNSTNTSTDTDSSNNGDSQNSNTDSDSTYVPPISENEFINMSYQQKIDFVNSLDAEEKQKFMNSLTTAERNSIIKQMNTDAKSEILNQIVDAGSAMGYNFSVDEFSGDKLSISMRDNSGTLVGVTNMGVVVDDTGKSYTTLVLSMVGIVAMAIAGLFGISKRLNTK